MGHLHKKKIELGDALHFQAQNNVESVAAAAFLGRCCLKMSTNSKGGRSPEGSQMVRTNNGSTSPSLLACLQKAKHLKHSSGPYSLYHLSAWS